MAELHPIPFPELLGRMERELSVAGSIFDLPVRKWFRPEGSFDFSATHAGRRAATPVGPAAGPHTQLTQNIVLAWLAGGRIMELKTVQVRDDLEIPRPCIHVPNVGFNVEWSQELRVSDSLGEYAKALYLIEVLKQTRAFGTFESAAGFETVFDMSVGYDLAGIRSPKVTEFIRALQRSEALLDGLRGQLAGDLAEFRDLELPDSISNCITLSTFHGCPANQIEAIALFLMEELGLHVILKLNPTLLGLGQVRHLLHDRMGYTHLRLRPEAFEMDLKYADALLILRRLKEKATTLGTTVGAKFTNTLVLENDPRIFPTQNDPYMYLSGPPLHVISMSLMQRFREDLDFEFPVSFSAGIDSRNFPAAVACGMVPVTTCTDLLRQGGFGRLPAYLRSLRREMEGCGVRSREAFVLAVGGHGGAAIRRALIQAPGGADVWREQGEALSRGALEAPDSLPTLLREVASAAGLPGNEIVLSATRIAGRLNGRDYVDRLPEDERYHWAGNSKPPRSVESKLATYDCLNCDICVPACPNDAIFVFNPEPVSAETERISLPPGGPLKPSKGAGFTIKTDHQLAVFDGACNECSNCEVYCPEVGAPYRVKERVFASLGRLEDSEREGFYGEGNVLVARLGERIHRLEVIKGENRARLTVSGNIFIFRWEPLAVLAWERASDSAAEEAATVREDTEPIEAVFDTAALWRMKTVWEHIFHSRRPNPVNPGGR
ncbi:MAG: glutamate synthase [Gemmatimonadota bacterium]|jgi:putative selenate reductase